MLDATQCDQVRRTLPAFSLAEPCLSTVKVDLCLHTYLEYYGFFETFKGIDVEFFWGYRCTKGVGRIATYHWRMTKSRGYVLLVHGLFDHVGLFLPLVRHLLEQGYSVVALDLPGHGLSDGEPTAIDSFDQYRDALLDALTFFAPLTAPLPIYGVGQSTGAAALMSVEFYWHRQNTPSAFERLVFLGPLVRPRQWRAASWAYRLIGRWVKVIGRDFSVANSHDNEFHNFLKSYDPLQARQLSTRWVGALKHWVDGFAAQPVVDTPLLVVQGTGDMVVDWQANVPLIKAHFSCVQVNVIEGAKHHLANEADPWRKAIYTGISQFFRQRVVCTLPG